MIKPSHHGKTEILNNNATGAFDEFQIGRTKAGRLPEGCLEEKCLKFKGLKEERSSVFRAIFRGKQIHRMFTMFISLQTIPIRTASYILYAHSTLYQIKITTMLTIAFTP